MIFHNYNLIKNKQLKHLALHIIHPFLLKAPRKEHLELWNEHLQVVVIKYLKHDSLQINVAEVVHQV